MIGSKLAFLLLLIGSALAWAPVSRREAMGTVISGAVMAPTFVAGASTLKPCAGSKDCFQAEWTPPSGTSKQDAVDTFMAVLNAYPGAGLQGNKDTSSGWTFIEDVLAKSGTARVAFKSAGKTSIGDFLSGCKPFQDELTVNVQDSGKIQIVAASGTGAPGSNKKVRCADDR